MRSSAHLSVAARLMQARTSLQWTLSLLMPGVGTVQHKQHTTQSNIIHNQFSSKNLPGLSDTFLDIKIPTFTMRLGRSRLNLFNIRQENNYCAARESERETVCAEYFYFDNHQIWEMWLLNIFALILTTIRGNPPPTLLPRKVL